MTTNTSKTGFLGITHGWWVMISLAYTLSPIDLVPALLLGPLGIVDNFGVLVFGFYSFIQWLKCRASSSSPPPPTSVPMQAARVTVIPATSPPFAPPRVSPEASLQRVRPGSDDRTAGYDARLSPRADTSAFEAQVIDVDGGAERCADPTAGSAERARTGAPSRGTDGRIATARLKAADAGAQPQDGVQ